MFVESRSNCRPGWETGGPGPAASCGKEHARWRPRWRQRGTRWQRHHRVDPHVNNLIKYRYSPHQFAKNGQNGGKKQMSGRSGLDCLISVPPGTVVSRIPTKSSRPHRGRGAGDGDLAPVPEDPRFWNPWPIWSRRATVVLCAGGRGRRGNMNFKSSTNQAPAAMRMARKASGGSSNSNSSPSRMPDWSDSPMPANRLALPRFRRSSKDRAYPLPRWSRD